MMLSLRLSTGTRQEFGVVLVCLSDLWPGMDSDCWSAVGLGALDGLDGWGLVGEVFWSAWIAVDVTTLARA